MTRSAPFLSFARRAGLGLLAAVALGSLASAASIKAVIVLDQGLTPETPATVRVELAPGEASEGARRRLEALNGTQVSLLLEGGQYGASRQVALGRVGAALQGRVEADGAGPYRIGLRLERDGRFYGDVVDIAVPARPQRVELTMEEPVTRSSVPIGQVALWALGATVVGLVALRGVSAF